MCGIVAYIGERDATPIIIEGLKKLEYRGYDSAGIAVLSDGLIGVRRDAGKIRRLEALVAEQPISGNIGIGHTRWATHGAPSQQNAHPHLSANGRVVVVHNGIVENYLTLREELSAEGVEFRSETDTETIAHLIEKFYAVEKDLFRAVQKTLQRLKGAHGLVVMSADEPDRLIAARLGNAGGVAIGVGEGEMFIASDVPAIVEHTRNMVFLESGQIAIIRKDHFQVENLAGKAVTPKLQTIPWDPVSAEKGNYRHFMQKEIHEQVRALSDTLIGRVDFDNYRIKLDGLNLDEQTAMSIQKIFITACGTAAHAGMVGKILLERIARIPVEVLVASEFRYADPIVGENDVVLAISQSGETADTLAAMEEGRKKGALLWSIVNAIGSQAMRQADGCISMQAGPEIGVASTKAFTAPLMDLYMLAVYLADVRGLLSRSRRIELVKDLLKIPSLVEKALEREPEVALIAEKFKDVKGALYLGRGINMPIAYEGALKLKEISYIHAEGYPAGEMKHGPIALVDKELPVVVIATKDDWYDKMISQVEQAKARGGKVIAVATEGDELIPTLADEIMWVPKTPWLLSPVVDVIPLQIFAYHIATALGLDVDQPRNLAKSVTVE
ncbi:MAG TPA: glutamine--fructose-6-phosphate transaminase (isomerizing) [Anaerolineaceae bacterium]|nr:glutamine--fructose-6-phosphate transaminase (isomerizing) [Anaerolineaceae bacterium]HPT24285.1 glutamine--fructose-6-phosphate transaminase (isomerizing) [Anaerolineaceae bacterium]